MFFKGFEATSSWFDPRVIEVNILTETSLLLENTLIKTQGIFISQYHIYNIQ